MARIVCLILLLTTLPLSAFAGPVDDINKAVNWIDRKDCESAKKILLPMAESEEVTDTQKAYVYHLLSICADRAQDALRYSKRATELDPKNSDALKRYTDICISQQNYTEAIASSTKLLDLVPASAEAFGLRGIAYRETGQLDKAIEDFTAAINIDGGIGINYARRGIAYFKKNDLDKALADFKQAQDSRLPPSARGECYYYIAKIAHTKRDFRNAETNYLSAKQFLADKQKLEEADIMLSKIHSITEWQ